MNARRYRLPALCLLAGVLLWGAATAARPLLRAGDGLTAHYYPNTSWDGLPALTVVDADPSTALIADRWGARTPPAFSIAWTGFLAVGRSGVYEFTTTSDDGSRIYVDGALVVDNGGTHASLTRSGRVRLDRGAHRLMIDFVQASGGYRFDWLWAVDGGTTARVPAWALSRRSVNYSRAVTARVVAATGSAAATVGLLGAVWLVLVALGSAATRVGSRPFRAPAGLVRGFERGVAIAACVLPVFFVVHATLFWGHGIVDQEATTFIVNYLADRPFVATIFDPRLNDWGSYQARELSYVFDFTDARLFAALLDRHMLVMVPLSGVLCLVAAAVVYASGARRTLRMDRTTVGLLLTLFLSCIVTQASTGIFYRSSKIVLTVFLLAFLFQLTGLATEQAADGRRSNGRMVGLFLLGLAMSMSDRQGFFFLLVATTIVATLWARDVLFSGTSGPARWRTNRLRVVVVCVAAIVADEFYNVVLAPQIIFRTNGYWPDTSYQDVPFVRLTWAVVWRSFEMFGAQIRYLFGNAPLAVIGVFAALLGVAISRSDRGEGRVRWVAVWTSNAVIVTAASLGALVALLVLMIVRHPPIGWIPDHAFWYYTLSLQAALLFGVTLLASRLNGDQHRHNRLIVQIVLLMMIAGNVVHYRAQRHIMIESGEWFGKQYAFAELYVHDFKVMDGQDRSARALPSWIHLGASGVTAEWPPPPTCFLDNVQVAHATLAKRPPVAEAGGPHWEALRGFLWGEPSLWSSFEETSALLQGLHAIGVRRLNLDRSGFAQAGEGHAAANALRTAAGPRDRVSEDGTVVSIALGDRPDRRSAEPALAAVPMDTFRVTPSGDSIRVDFDRPREIRRIRTAITEETLSDYPRRFVVESVEGPAVRTLYNASALGPMMKGLLKEPLPAPLEIDISPGPVRTLLLREAGRVQSWNWSLHPLMFYEPR